MQKECPDCRETKPAADFGRNRSLTDGLSFYCLECSRARSNAWYRRRRRSLGKEVRDLSWVPNGFRWCPSCRQAVRVEDYTLNSASPSGFGGRCKQCHNEAGKDAYLYRTYRLTRKQLERIRAAQDNRCAICGEASPRHLDHDHESGRIRALLCQRCNHGLGLFRDEPDLLFAAGLYVSGHRGEQALQLLQEASTSVSDGGQPTG